MSENKLYFQRMGSKLFNMHANNLNPNVAKGSNLDHSSLTATKKKFKARKLCWVQISKFTAKHIQCCVLYLILKLHDIQNIETNL